MTEQIALSRGLVAVVDDGDYAYLSQWKWYAARQLNTYYAMRHQLGKNGKRTTISMHQVILGTAPGMHTDHIDGDGLNNTRNNLRICNASENARNRQAGRNNKSGYKGVFWNPQNKRWRAKITHMGKGIWLGSFGTPEEAAAAYDRAAIKLHGEFASPNMFGEEMRQGGS